MNLFDKKLTPSYYDKTGRNTIEAEQDGETLKVLLKGSPSVGDLRRGA